jgi:hypothetical protein
MIMTLIRPLVIAVFGLLLTQTASANLITNGSNEDSLVGGEIPGWAEVSGNNWTQRSASPAPYEGNFYFFAGIAASAELAQIIDVSSFSAGIDAGIQEFSFEAYVTSFIQTPADSTQLILEFLDASNALLDSFDSGAIIDTTGWQQVTDVRLAPIDTRSINVRLIATRQNGSNNDGYFDAVSLTTRNTAVPEPSMALLFISSLVPIAFLVRRRKKALSAQMNT